jgi:hypothetical protein
MFANNSSRLIVEFDSQANEVRVSTMSSSGQARVQISSIPLDGYSGSQARSNIVGKVILDALQTLAGLESEDVGREDLIVSLIKPNAIAGDVRAMRVLASFCELKALRTGTPELLTEAESWLQQAIDLGDKETEHFFLTIWPSHKEHVLSMINGKR